MTEKLSFEEAYDRLEEILEKMNAEQVSLDKALSLYEEADGLIGSCQKQLNEAEQKIEMLIKKRENEAPTTEEFSPENQSSLRIMLSGTPPLMAAMAMTPFRTTISRRRETPLTMMF